MFSLSQELLSSLAGQFWLRFCLSHQATVTQRLHWVCRRHFQDGALPRLLAVGLSSSPHGPLLRVPEWGRLAFPRAGDPGESSKEKAIVTSMTVLKAMHCHIHHILLGKGESLSPAHTQGMESGLTLWREECQRICGQMWEPRRVSLLPPSPTKRWRNIKEEGVLLQFREVNIWINEPLHVILAITWVNKPPPY